MRSTENGLFERRFTYAGLCDRVPIPNALKKQLPTDSNEEAISILMPARLRHRLTRQH